MKPFLNNLNRYKNFLILLFLIGLFGYTARQISLVVNSTPDPAYVDQQKQAATAGSVKIDTKTIDAVNSLAPVNDSTGISATTKSDPFTQ